MIYNLSLLMSRRSAGVCCVFVHMFLHVFMCVCLWVDMCSRSLRASAQTKSKNDILNHQSHCVLGDRNLQHHFQHYLPNKFSVASGFKVVMATLLPWLL